ncbi:MAG: porin [Roseovarius sp.]|uniref:porin n=1 Tax=Roseovarius sp. TaxID=1486281 RepID=UPI0032F073AD
MFRVVCAALALCICVSTAHAQQLDIDGELRVGATSLYGGEGIGAADIIVGFDFFRTVPLGAELGFYGFAGKPGRPHETYVALTWNDTWRVGFTPSVYDTVLKSTFDHAAPRVGLDRVEYTRSLATVEPIRRAAVPAGVSYTGSFGQTIFAASAHHANKGDFTALALAVSREWEDFTLSGAVEGVWADALTNDGINAKLGGSYDFGATRIGLAYLHPDANARPDTLALDFAWSPTKGLDLLAFGEISLEDTDDAYGVAADFILRDSTSWILSATDSSGGSAFHATLEQRF